MTEAEWLACNHPKQMLPLLMSHASDRKRRLLAAACCRRIWPLLTDERSRQVVEVVEDPIDGRARKKELADAILAADEALAAAHNWTEQLGHCGDEYEATMWEVSALSAARSAAELEIRKRNGPWLTRLMAEARDAVIGRAEPFLEKVVKKTRIGGPGGYSPRYCWKPVPIRYQLPSSSRIPGHCRR